jgi:methionyl-tRNA formyltransferase
MAVGRGGAVRRSCILLTTDGAGLREPATHFAERHFDLRHVAAYDDPTDERLDPALFELVKRERVDYLFSFLSPVIVPPAVLDAVGLPVNFHPAPPRWPGIGGACYALYHDEADFGVTAHVMAPRVDTGAILRVRSFPILPDDSQTTLLERARHHALTLYFDLLTELLLEGSLQPSGDEWERSPMRGAALEQWKILSATDSPEEVTRRIRAFAHPRFPGPYVDVGGFRFAYVDEAGIDGWRDDQDVPRGGD